MKTGTILLLLLLTTLVAACAKTTSDAQEQAQANVEPIETTSADNATSIIEDETLETELDPLEDIGTLDELPVDDSIPE